MSDELSGALAPPMLNGEAVFEMPWQGRIFGMAHALADAGLISWDEFRKLLIEEIAGWDRSGTGDYAYYDHFQRALERLLTDRGILSLNDLAQRSAVFGARPDGHDHDHLHDHDHRSGEPTSG